MGKLYIVTGRGHCGTAWLADAFAGLRGVRAIHEAAKHWSPRKPTGKQWKVNALMSLRDGVTDPFFNYYFTKMLRLLESKKVILDSHSWLPSALPIVAQRVPIAGIIHLVRDGVQNVHSLHTIYRKKHPFWFGRVIEHETGLKSAGQFEAWCTWWAHNYATVEHLRSQGFNAKAVRLEDLTRDEGALIELADWMGVEMSVKHAQTKQGRDINRHSKGKRHPLHLWFGWTDAQRETFRRICKTEMSHFDYWREEYD